MQHFGTARKQFGTAANIISSATCVPSWRCTAQLLMHHSGGESRVVASSYVYMPHRFDAGTTLSVCSHPNTLSKTGSRGGLSSIYLHYRALDTAHSTKHVTVSDDGKALKPSIRPRAPCHRRCHASCGSIAHRAVRKALPAQRDAPSCSMYVSLASGACRFCAF